MYHYKLYRKAMMWSRSHVAVGRGHMRAAAALEGPLEYILCSVGRELQPDAPTVGKDSRRIRWWQMSGSQAEFSKKVSAGAADHERPRYDRHRNTAVCQGDGVGGEVDERCDEPWCRAENTHAW